MAGNVAVVPSPGNTSGTAFNAVKGINYPVDYGSGGAEVPAY